MHYLKEVIIMAVPNLEITQLILAVIVGTLAAIVYSLRVLLMLERRVAVMELNIQRMTRKVLREQSLIVKKLNKSARKRKPAKNTTRKRR